MIKTLDNCFILRQIYGLEVSTQLIRVNTDINLGILLTIITPKHSDGMFILVIVRLFANAEYLLTFWNTSLCKKIFISFLLPNTKFERQ